MHMRACCAARGAIRAAAHAGSNHTARWLLTRVRRPQILIANNGMAAAKAIMSIRRWAFLTLGDDQAIQFVAMVRALRARAALALPRARRTTRR